MKPFFVVGAERSGTTILGSLLGAPANGLTIPESHFFVENALSDHRAGTFQANLPAILEAIKGNPRFLRWELELPGIAEKQMLAQTQLQGFWEILVRAYGQSRGRPNPDYWVDHSPMNALHVRSLVEIFPDSRFVHIVRDPRAVAASLFGLDWGPNTVESFVGYWLQKVGAAFAGQVLFPERFVLVKYEDLAGGDPQVLMTLGQSLGLGALDADQPIHFEIPAASRAQHSYLGNGLATGVSSDWSRYLDARAVEEIEGSLGGIMDMLGYKREFPNARVTFGTQRRRSKVPRLLHALLSR